jgi:hypothetical protein
MPDVKTILLELGFSNISESQNEFRMRPIYRDSNNNTVLSVKKDSGRWIDFARGQSGSLQELVKITLKLKNIDEAGKWLGSKNFSLENKETSKPLIKSQKKLDKSSLAKVIKDHSYWNGRGISNLVLNRFDGGIVLEGKMANRYIFPIFNSKNDLVGVVGRDLLKPSETRPKWKIISNASLFCYPLHINSKTILSKKEIILVESIGDLLSLFEMGIENVAVIFGLEIGCGLLNFMIKADVQKIHIILNNDQNLAGNNGAEKTKTKLSKYFDENQINIITPEKNDLNEMLTDDRSNLELFCKKHNL